jgi:hypothetical protein
LKVFPAKAWLLLATPVNALFPGTTVILLLLYLILDCPRPLLLLTLIVLRATIIDVFFGFLCWLFVISDLRVTLLIFWALLRPALSVH